MRAFWIDDDAGTIGSLVGHPDCRNQIEVSVFAEVQSAVDAYATAEDPPALVILDVQDRDGGSIPSRAARTELAKIPWLVVSDLASGTRVPGTVVARSTSAHLRNRTPGEIARVLLGVIDECRREVPPVSRTYVQLLAHSIRAQALAFMASRMAATGASEGVIKERLDALARSADGFIAKLDRSLDELNLQ